MFTLVTRGPRDRWSLESCLCDSSPATKQRRCSDRHRCRYRCGVAECEVSDVSNTNTDRGRDDITTRRLLSGDVRELGAAEEPGGTKLAILIFVLLAGSSGTQRERLRTVSRFLIKDPKMSLLLFGITALHIIILIILFVATLDSSWWVLSQDETLNLWHDCIYNNSSESWMCTSVSTNGDPSHTRYPIKCTSQNVSTKSGQWFHAVQALVVLSVLFSSFSFMLFMCQLYTMDKGGLFYATGVFQILATDCPLPNCGQPAMNQHELGRQTLSTDQPQSGAAESAAGVVGDCSEPVPDRTGRSGCIFGSRDLCDHVTEFHKDKGEGGSFGHCFVLAWVAFPQHVEWHHVHPPKKTGVTKRDTFLTTYVEI
ncbi:unnamed protein product [Ranitomeya imitator]|uniref:Uncharacterized protein n=1 Tax=Ranitomeya imitator TaxID=111125 RepID=A0ABN9M6L8_9NEOB|nr:unnamed protein product [Ranitomeya imitator]